MAAGAGHGSGDDNVVTVINPFIGSLGKFTIRNLKWWWWWWWWWWSWRRRWWWWWWWWWWWSWRWRWWWWWWWWWSSSHVYCYAYTYYIRVCSCKYIYIYMRVWQQDSGCNTCSNRHQDHRSQLSTLCLPLRSSALLWKLTWTSGTSKSLWLISWSVSIFQPCCFMLIWRVCLTSSWSEMLQGAICENWSWFTQNLAQPDFTIENCCLSLMVKSGFVETINLKQQFSGALLKPLTLAAFHL